MSTTAQPAAGETAAAGETPRVLVVHNRYRTRGGEERAVELQLDALERAGIACRALERDSAAIGRARAARAMLAGGRDPAEVERAARALGATAAHFHNIQPLFGPAALAAARRAGARVVLELHNFRLFCAIGVAFRDGAPCFRCRRGTTLPGLALNCRGSLPEAAVYALALARQLEPVLGAVDRFVAPSAYAVGQLVRLGVPADRIEALPHYLPEEEVAEGSRAGDGEFVLYAGRLAPEKGVDAAIQAAAMAGFPLKVAGEGPLAERLYEQAAAMSSRIELLGRLGAGELRELRARAAAVVIPSVWDEIAPYSALEAMAAGVPVIATRTGGLPELVGESRCVERGDVAALAEALDALWRDPARRAAEGAALISRVREFHSEGRYLAELLRVYGAP